MNSTKDIIIKLKKSREDKGYSFNDILKLMEENGDYLSKSTVSRIFAEGSENSSFRYEETIRPIAKVLLDIETIEETDKKYMIQRIEELEKQLKEATLTYLILTKFIKHLKVLIKTF